MAGPQYQSPAGGDVSRDLSAAVGSHAVPGSADRLEGRDAERAVDLEADRLDLFAPVQVWVDNLGICRHDLADLLGNLAHLHRIGADHTELHREAHRRTEHEAVHSSPRFRQGAIGKSFFEPGQPVTDGVDSKPA